MHPSDHRSLWQTALCEANDAQKRCTAILNCKSLLSSTQLTPAVLTCPAEPVLCEHSQLLRYELQCVSEVLLHAVCSARVARPYVCDPLPVSRLHGLPASRNNISAQVKLAGRLQQADKVPDLRRKKWRLMTSSKPLAGCFSCWNMAQCSVCSLRRQDQGGSAAWLAHQCLLPA